MADANGLVVVPSAAVDETLKRARMFSEMEIKVKAAIDAGEAPVAVHKSLHYDLLFGLTPASLVGSGRIIGEYADHTGRHQDDEVGAQPRG